VLDREEFGRFSVVYLGVVVAMSAIRPVTGEVLLLPTTEARHDAQALGGSAAGLTLALALVPAVAMCGIALSWAPPAAGAAALAIPLAAVQDNVRYQAFAARRPAIAAVSDFITLAPVAVVLAVSGRVVQTSSPALLALAGGAFAGTVAALVQLRTNVRWRGLRAFGSATRGARRAGLLEFGSNALVTQVPLLVMPLTAPFRDLAAIRGLQLSFAPVTVVHAAAFALIMPRLGDAFAASGTLRLGLLRTYVVALSGVTVVLAGSVHIVPSSVLAAAFGDTAGAVRPHVWAFAVVQLVAIATGALAMALRASDSYGRVARARVLLAAATVAAVLVLAGRYGVVGACVGLTLPQLVFVAVGSRSMARTLRGTR
jgi:hypothetical protein